MKKLILLFVCLFTFSFNAFSEEEKKVHLSEDVFEIFISKESPELFYLYAFTPCSTYQNVYLDGVWQGWQITYSLSLGCSGSVWGPDIHNYTCYICQQ